MSEKTASTGPSRDERIEAAFDAAIQAGWAERGSVLDRMCGGDVEMRAEVESLLAHARETRDFLESPLLPGVAAMPMPLPDTIGPFKILSVLGEGGMGCVYEAQQERPQRRVAIKVVRPEAMTPSALRRFDREIETLGQLRHPCIAQLYEVGQQPGASGRVLPYLVMELVRGVSLTKFVREGQLGIRERVELLALVADAVQYAHQRGVVHRDLKPENILVERAEGMRASPKILDFGIARLTDGSAEASQTVVGHPMGTLAYMSPEQFAADPAGIDTRCDVYALGVIGYEVFAGARPLDVTGMSLVQAAKLIETSEPTRLGTLDKRLRGDLETIIAKAMSKDRDARYATAAALAEDLRRHLRDEPILARAPSAGYQIVKFARRNRVLVSVGGAGVAALIAGMVTSTVLYVREQGARKRAAEAAALSEGVRDYMISGLLLAAAPERMGYDVKMVDVLTNASAGLHERFKDNPEVEAAVRYDLGTVLGQLGRLRESAAEFRLAIPLLEATVGKDDEKTISALTSLSNTLDGVHDNIGALEAAQEGLRRAKRVLPADHPRALSARNNIGAALHAMGRADEAIGVLKEGLELAEHDPVKNAHVIGAMLSQLSACERVLGNSEKALEWTLRAMDHAQRVFGPMSEMGVMSRNNAVNAMFTNGRQQEAAKLTEGLVEDAEKVFAPGHANRAYVYLTTSNVMLKAGRHEEAERYAIRGYEAIVSMQGDVTWSAEQALDAVRRVYLAWPGHQEELKVWSVRALRTRMMVAGPGELKASLDLLVKFTSQCTRAGANMSHGGLLETLWRDRETLAPKEHPRRANYYATYALLCDVIEGCEHAKESLVIAEEAVKTATEGKKTAEELIEVGRKRIEK